MVSRLSGGIPCAGSTTLVRKGNNFLKCVAPLQQARLGKLVKSVGNCVRSFRRPCCDEEVLEDIPNTLEGVVSGTRRQEIIERIGVMKTNAGNSGGKLSNGESWS